MNPDDIISPAVLTSRQATEDYGRIQSMHSNIVKGMANQAAKVAQYQDSMKMEEQQQGMMRQEQEKLGFEREKSYMDMDTRLKEKKMDFDQKQAELEVKKLVLSNNDG